MRSTSNPAFRNLPRGTGNYVGFDPQAGTPGYGNYGAQPGYAGPGGPGGPGGYGVAYQQSGAVERPMTIDDVVTKTAITLGLALVTGIVTIFTHAYWLAAPAAIVGLVLALIVIFKRTPSPALVLSYAAAEGIVLGAITELFDNIYPGIAFQAIAGTFGVFVAMLVVYKTGAIRVTPRLTKWVIGATFGVVIVLLANFVVGMFGVNLGIRDGSPLSIVISVVIIGIAAFNLLLDFDQADRMIRSGMPARWAWYAAFGLTVTLVWLYLEILRLLSYLQRGN
ncbi:MAG TPA: Bax inhibitor-1/YccA family protein [Pseudonocardiaceae bacterium]|nr:Bax inhibitor-1/YccA family protein [Pseudonocardiaceae bacterium]